MAANYNANDETKFWSLLRAGRIAGQDDSVSEDLTSHSATTISEPQHKPQGRGRVKGVGVESESEEESEYESDENSEEDSIDYSDSDESVADGAAVKELEGMNQTLKSRLRESADKIHTLQQQLDSTKYLLSKASKGTGTMLEVGNNKALFEARGNRRITHVSAGVAHCLALNEGGQVYVWGKGSEGQLGLGDSKPKQTPTPLSLPNARFVFAGHNHSFAITEQGNVFAWGDNSSGQLGLGDRQKRTQPTPIKALQEHEIVSISGGKGHTVAVTEQGLVFTWGDGTQHQLGHGDKTAVLEPKQVVAATFATVRSATATNDSTVVIAEGDVRVPKEAPGRSDVNGTLAYLQESLSRLRTKREKYVDSIVGEAKELRRKVGALEREIGKSDADTTLLLADCRLVNEAIVEEEKLLDFENWEEMKKLFDTLQRENELLKGHLLAQHAAPGGGSTGVVVGFSNNPSNASSDGDGSLESEPLTAEPELSDGDISDSDLDQLRDLLAQRAELRRGLRRAQRARSGTQNINTQINQINNSILETIGLEGFSGGSKVDQQELALAQAVYDKWIILQNSTTEKLPEEDVEDKQLGVRDLLRESNIRITSVITNIQAQFGVAKEVTPEPKVLLPALLLANAHNMKRINDYMEGVLMQTMNKLEEFKGAYVRQQQPQQGTLGMGMARTRLC